MRYLFVVGGVISVVVWLAATAPAATVQFEIMPAGGQAGAVVIVRPGSQVSYRITAQVFSGNATTTDHNGLASFRVDVLTDLGIAQSPADQFSDLIASQFTLLSKLGQSKDDDIVEIGASQDTFMQSTPPQAGIAVGQAQTLVLGTLVTPDVEGNYAIQLGSQPSANVFKPDTTEVVKSPKPSTKVGVGFTIRTSNTAVSADDSDNLTETAQQSTADPDPAAILTRSFGLVALAAFLTFMALMGAGPVSAIAVLILALIGLLGSTLLL